MIQKRERERERERESRKKKDDENSANQQCIVGVVAEQESPARNEAMSIARNWINEKYLSIVDNRASRSNHAKINAPSSKALGYLRTRAPQRAYNSSLIYNATCKSKLRTVGMFTFQLKLIKALESAFTISRFETRFNTAAIRREICTSIARDFARV